MNPSVQYRLRLAEGFLKEAQQDWALARWRACVAHAQLSVENALKAVIALFLPLPKTHDPARLLLHLIDEGQVPQEWRAFFERLAEEARLLGPQVHIQTDYGDEFGGLTPWELFTRDDAQAAVETATRLFALVRDWITEHYTPSSDAKP